MKDDWVLGQRAADGDDDAFIELYERNVAGLVGSWRATRRKSIFHFKDQSKLELADRLSSADAVCGAVRSLPLEQQLVIILNLLVGGSDQEIAEWMGRSAGDVRKIREAAQQGLRRHLQGIPAR